MKSKLFALVLVCIASANLSTMWAYDYDFKVDSLYYTITSDTTVEIARDDSYKAWTELSLPNKVTHDGVEYAVTGIAQYAFYQCQKLASITFPDNLVYIGHYSFSDCAFTELVIPEKVTSIRGCAFEFCDQITSVSLPNSLQEIQGHAFYGNHSLKSITIPQYVTNIATDAFNNSGLTTVIWNAMNYQNPYSGSPFQSVSSSITSFVFGEMVIHIPAYICCHMYNCADVTIPESVASVGEYAFLNCKWLSEKQGLIYINRVLYKCNDQTLTEITIKDGTVQISSSAFYGCSSLASITIPESVTSIGSSAFYGCSSLTKTNYLGDIAGWCGIAFANEEANPIYYSNNLYLNDQEVVDLVIPNTVDTVISNTFRNCQSIKSVTIPESVTYLADNAFEGSGLKSIVWRPKNYINTSSYSPFRYIRDRIQSITFAETVDTIPYRMCYEMYNLKTVNIGKDVNNVKSEAFYGCSSLTKTNYLGDIAGWCGIAFATIDANPIYYSKNLYLNDQEVVDLVIPNTVDTVISNTFRNCQSIKSVTIPESVTYLANNAFEGSGLKSIVWRPKNYINTSSSSPFRYIRDSIQSITFAETVDTIPYNMCHEMYNLKTVNIGKNVNNVNSSAFYGCSSLTKTNYLGDIAGWCGIAFATIDANPIYYSKNLYLNDQEVVDLVIPNTVDTVISNTFRNCQSIKSVTIPESVTYLANDAFEGSGLKSIVWRPKNYINTSSSSPFHYIKDSIQSITFAETVDTIPNYMSYQMSNMKTLNIGQNVKHIGEWAFAYCYALDSIVIPEGVTSVYYDAFRYTAVKSITIPESITFLASDVFQNTSLNSVIWLPKNYNNTTSESLFHWIKDSVRTITFGDNVESIPYRMCYNMTNLTTINVGKNVKRIGKEAFYGVPFDDGLVYIGRVLYGYWGTMSANYNLILRDSTISIAPNAFQDQSNLLLVTFNEGLEEIGSEAFRNCQALLSLKFPNSLRSIDEAAFYDCKGLTMIKFGTKLEHLGANAFRYCAAINTSVSLPDAFSTIGRGVFEGCSNIPSIVIQGTVKRIEESAFNGCSKLTQLTLPNTVNYIGQYAMYNCSALKEIALPTALKKIDRSAFENNHTLTSLVIPNSVDTLAYRAFYNCDGLTSVQLGDGLRYLGGESFCESGNIRSVTFGKSLFNIDDRAFQNCGQLQAAHFNNNLTRIGVEAFRYCSNLRSVSFGEALSTIGERAFKRSGVTSIDLSKTHVTSLPTRVFRECFNLECIVFPTTLQTISSEAFYACSSLKILELPHGITSLDNSTFYGCSALTSVHIPNSVVTIMNNVFRNCGKLLSVTLPNSVMSIGAESFYSCSALKTLNLEMNAPISIGSNAFYGVNFTAINVPCGSKNTYLEDERWAVYADIMNEASLSNYELIALPTDGKSGVVDIQVPSCDSDGAYTLTAQPNYGYKFTHWNDGNTANPRQVVLTQDTSFIATMVRDGFAINAVANYPERGEVIGDTVALYGDTVTLTVIPNYGYYFDYWEDRRNYGNSDSQKKANPRQVIADKDTTYTAVLQKNPYNIKVNVANGEYGTVSSSTTSAYYLDTITITANPIVGYQLAHWNDGNTDNPRKFILTQDTVFTATFRQAYADKCGDNAYWSYDQQGTLTITGSGDMYNYSTSNAPWQLFKDSIQVINISDDITRIGSYAFYNIKGVKSLVIPTSLTCMGGNAIVGCDSLVTLVWNARSLSVQNLGGLNASRLQSITFGAEVVDIPDNICNTMRSLKHLVLPESVRTIGYRSFYDCDSLVYVSIPTLVDSIGAEAFNACDRIDTIVWNAINVSKSSHGNLNRSTVSHIEFGSQVEYILNDMCNGMTKLQEVSIPESVKIIGSNAFRGCTGLKTLIIPESITSVGGQAFYNCSGLTSVVWKAINCPTVPNNWVYRSSITSFTFDDKVEVIPSYLCSGLSKLTSITLPENLTHIGNDAFYGCSSLASLVIPSKVIAIGGQAFYNCSQMTSLVVPSALNQLDVNAFYNTPIADLTIAANSLEQYLQSNVNELLVNTSISQSVLRTLSINGEIPTEIIVPNTITKVQNYAFYQMKDVKSVILPATITKIGSSAFNTSSITSVTIPSTVDSIGQNVFDGSTLADVVITANSLEQYLQSNINMLLLNAGATISRILMVNGVEVINVIVPNGITEIKDKAFYMMRNITSVNIPESVTKMGIYAFAESKNLEVVKLPNSLDTIASYAFRNCVKLSTLELRDSIKHIDKYAFANCSTLVSVRLPEGLKSIEAYAFSHCTNLTEVHLPMLLPPTITATTFYNTTKLSKYYVPCGAKGNYTATINWSTYASKIYERYYTDYIITTASSNDAWGIVTLTEPTSCADTTYQFVAKPYYGYHFVQWQDGNTNNPRIIALTQDTAFIAEFARNTYIVSTESNFPERGTTSDPQPALYLDSVVIAATPNYGYHFTQWDDGNTDNPRVVVVTETITYNALFDKNPYTISINYNGEHGKVDAPEVALYMDEVEIEVKSKNGYHFTHWNDGNTDNPRSVTITQDTAFTVYFAINEYNIIVKANHEERGTTIGSGTYRHGDTLTISASANYGYYFSRWDNGVTDNPRQVVALDNTTYTALFAMRQFNITTQSTDDIRGQVKAPEIAEYLDEVTITAVPNYGYHFTHWNDGNTDNPRVFTLTQDTLFIASFDRNTYYVQAMPNNEVRGVTTGTGNYLYLDTVELSATSNYGFHFVQWQDAAGNMLSENSRYRVEVTEDVEYIARFDGEVFTITSLSTDDTRGHVEAPATAEYLSDITITAVPKFGYHFTHWNDGNTDNPRVFTLTQDTTFAASFEYTTAGECGEQTYWNYQDGELLISGAGEMTNYVETSVPWLLFKPQIKTVKITEGITSIGENAFYNCTHLTNVELPNSLLDIEAWAFADCPELTSFAIPTSIIEINQNAFKGCTSIHTIEWNAIRYSDDVTLSTTPFRVLSDYITTIIVGEQVAHIPTDLFPAMAALKIVKWNATAGEDYYTYDKTPFYHNRSRITNFTIGNNVTIIPAYLCYDMNAITSITLPNSVEQIEAYAFAESAISKIAMGTALTHIGYRAFANCEAITELTINSSVKTIDRYAFYNCQNLKTLRIGSGVTALGDHAFDECPRITDIYCYAVMPPVAESKTFYSYQPTLYVGYASGEAYHSDEVFKLFNNIIYYDYTALEDVVINGLQIKDGLVCCEQSFRIYDLIGNDVTHCNGVLQGIYIVRTDYASQKVVLISNTNH